MILLPSKNKYLEFRNFKNTVQHNLIAFADIESYMNYQDKNVYEHKHLMSGYYLHRLDEKYSKKAQLFDKSEDFRDNLIKELDYIENINENVLNYENVNFENSIVTIIIYLADKHNLKIPNIIKYSKDRENTLNNINKDRMTAKKVIISILNGGFSAKYNNDININEFLKDIEEDSKFSHEYFYKIDKRIDDEKTYNYKAKSFSRILQDYENQLLMNLYDYFSFKK